MTTQTDQYLTYQHLVIAIDGPSASGKGTLSTALAQDYNLVYLETGILYRAVAYLCLQQYDEAFAKAGQIAQDFTYAQLQDLDLMALRRPVVSTGASKVGAMPPVRQALLEFQRQFAARIPAGKHGALLDGRDIGSVVCPNATVKIYMTADVETRARRRHAQLITQGQSYEYAEVLKRLQDRDERDQNRDDAPLLICDDALVIDTTHIPIAESINLAKQHIEARI